MLIRQKLVRRGVGIKMVLIAAEAVSVGSKPPATDGRMRISTDGRCDIGTSSPSLTRASPMHFSGAVKRGSTIMPKLVKLVEPSSTLAQELSPFFTLASVGIWFYVCLRGETRLQRELHASGLLGAGLSISSPGPPEVRPALFLVGRSDVSFYRRSSCQSY